MGTIIKLLTSIGNLVISLVSFLISTIRSLLYLVQEIPNFINFLSSSFTVLPTVFIPFCLASVSIFVIYFILGRQVG